MKTLIFLIAMIVGLNSNATAGELQILTKEVNGETVIICVTPDELGEIEMAYIKFHNDIKGRLSEMELVGGSNATFTVPGNHQVIEGKVNVLMADLSREIIRKEFAFRN